MNTFGKYLIFFKLRSSFHKRVIFFVFISQNRLFSFKKKYLNISLHHPEAKKIEQNWFKIYKFVLLLLLIKISIKVQRSKSMTIDKCMYIDIKEHFSL